jgi:hypothetical protein
VPNSNLLAPFIIFALTGCQQIYPYVHAPEAKISLGCGGDFRIRTKKEKMLVIPYALTELIATTCASGPLEARAVQAVEQHLIKTNRLRCTVGPAQSLPSQMIEVEYKCP